MRVFPPPAGGGVCVSERRGKRLAISPPVKRFALGTLPLQGEEK